MDFVVSSKKLRLVIDGVGHEFRAPSIADTEWLAEQMSEAGTNARKSIEIYCEFFERLGLSRDIFKQLHQDSLTEFLNHVLVGKKNSPQTA